MSLMLAVAIAACGGSNGATPTQTSASATPAATAVATPPAITATAVGAAPPAASPTHPPPTATPPAPPPVLPVTVVPAATATVGAGGPAPAVVVGAVAGATMRYYDVTGTTVSELRASMDAQGPVDSGGRRNDAFTAWNIDWTWALNPDSSCSLASATVNTTITVTFPRWLPPSGAQAALVERWNAYESALVTHEGGHVSYVIETAGDVLAAIKGATCDTADGAAQAVVARIRQHDIDYDAATNHGYTEGAHFP